MDLYFRILPYFVLFLGSNFAEECEFEKYSEWHDRVIASCTNKTLTQLPSKRFHQFVNWLKFDYNLLEELPSVAFAPNNDLLVIVNVSYNKIHIIHKDAFSKMDKLHQLDLSYNNITAIVSHTFEPCKQLNTLLLNGNPLISLAGLSQIPVKKLDISDCQLTTETLTKDKIILPHLISFIADRNQFTIFPASVIAGLQSVRKYHLANNNLTLFEGDENNCQYVNELSFRGNPFFLPKLNFPRLEKLLLGDCSITHIPKDYFKKSGKLRYIFMPLNNITKIPQESIMELKELVLIDFLNNPLDCDCTLMHTYNNLQRRGIDVFVTCGKNLTFAHKFFDVLDCSQYTSTQAIPTTQNVQTKQTTPTTHAPEMHTEVQDSYTAVYVLVPLLTILLILLAAGGIWYWRRTHFHTAGSDQTESVTFLPFNNNEM